MSKLPGWLNGNVTWLLLCRVVRSFAQASIAIAMPLYLAAAGYSAVQIGYIISLTALGSMLAVLAVGFLCQRFGHKTMLIAIALVSLVGTTTYAVSTAYGWLALTAAISAMGRGGNAGAGGSFGPFYPAEQPLVASSASDQDRNAVFSALSFVGVIGAALGSVAAMLPTFLQAHDKMAPTASFHPLFWTATGASLLLMVFIAKIDEKHVLAPPAPKNPKTKANDAPRPAAMSEAMKGFVARLWVTNGTLGIAWGVLGTFLAYYLHARYGATAAQVGMLYLIINLAAALPFLGAARLARRLGSVRAVSASRLASVVFLALMAVAPTFVLAGLFCTLRAMFNSLGAPIRQSFIMGVSDKDQRSKIAALSNLPSQVTSLASPTIAALLLELSLEAPVWLAAVAVAANGILYSIVFRHMTPPEEMEAQAEGPGMTETP